MCIMPCWQDKEPMSGQATAIDSAANKGAFGAFCPWPHTYRGPETASNILKLKNFNFQLFPDNIQKFND